MASTGEKSKFDTDVWPPEPTCRDLAGLEILMGFWLQAPFSQPIQV